MKAPVEVSIFCPKHGEVRVQVSDAEVLGYCPLCEHEARNPHLHPASPYPLEGTSPSVIPGCNRGD